MTTMQQTPGQLVGQRVKRREDPRLIKGRATYVDDIKLVGMLHMAVRRSDVAHGNIRDIDTSAAEAMDGVVAVFTGAQLKDEMSPMPIGTPFPAPDHYPVAHDKVRFVGEPIAVVVATDRYKARDGADAIVVDIEELPAVVDPEAAMEDGAPLIHEDFANNIAVGGVFAGTDVDPETMEHDDAKIDAAFAEAEVVVSQRMRNHRLIPNAIETRGCVAHYEGAKGQLTFWSGTQNPHLERIFISGAVGLGEHQVRVIAPEVGGGFGSKINIYGEAFIACILSKQLDAPIKWVADRSEDYLSTTHGRDLIAYVDIAANRDGKVLGLKFRLIQDIGGYEMILSALIPMLTNFMLSGTYDIPAIRSELTEVFTNKTSIDAYRGAGRPEGIYFVERAMDMLAVELDMDPAELRRRNFFKAADFPVTTQMGMVYDSGDYEALLDIALQNAGWEDLKRERDAARAEGRVVGLGLSSYVEICGLAPSAVLPTVGGWEYGSVSVERTGAITVTTGSSSHGQGHETTFAQMVSDQFGGIPLERIRVLHGDTGVVKAGIGTFGSRSQAVGGTALIKAGEKVKAKMARFAAHMMEAKEEDLVFADGKIFVKDVPESSLSFEEVAAYAYIPITLPRRYRARPLRRGLLGAGGHDLPLRLLHLHGRDRPRHRRALAAPLGRRRRLRQHHQPPHRRRADPRRHRPGHRPGAHRRGRLRRERAAADGLADGLRYPARLRLPPFRAQLHRHPHAAQPSGRQGRRRGRHHRLHPRDRQRHRRRPAPLRRQTRRHDAAPGKTLAPDAGHPDARK